MNGLDIAFIIIFSALGSIMVAVPTVQVYKAFRSAYPSKPKQIEPDYCYVCSQELGCYYVAWYKTSFKTCHACESDIRIDMDHALSPWGPKYKYNDSALQKEQEVLLYISKVLEDTDETYPVS